MFFSVSSLSLFIWWHAFPNVKLHAWNLHYVTVACWLFFILFFNCLCSFGFDLLIMLKLMSTIHLLLLFFWLALLGFWAVRASWKCTSFLFQLELTDDLTKPRIIQRMELKTKTKNPVSSGFDPLIFIRLGCVCVWGRLLWWAIDVGGIAH